jgi:CRISPR/Cas system CSM-associated protein Csm3 (group 7 of RAMP superfamily)
MSNERLNRNQRHIVERIIIKGNLILDTPTCLGNGDTDGPTDMMLLRDSISSHALLTGASIAGALRNYLREYQNGYEREEEENSLATLLFGSIRQDENGDQSPLIVHDSISSTIPKVELRDGVKIDSATGTATDKAKYDLELLASGTEFPLCFELLIEEGEQTKQGKDRNRLFEAVTLALRGLETGEIGIGMKKRRGLGCCHIESWQVWQFNLTDANDRWAWLLFLDSECTSKLPQKSQNIANIFTIPTTPDKRSRFFMEATFTLCSSMLIRSGQGETGAVPDAVHLKSYREGEEKPVLSGTSLTGVMRHRAERIIKTLGNDNSLGFLHNLFGIVEEDSKKAIASRLVIHETIIENVNELVQNRIAVDRFTGGAYHGALFEEQPIFGKDDTQVILKLELREPKEAEIGLLLLLLKDLWTSDLPLGGESSIGRGRLQGIEAKMERHSPENNDPIVWTIKQQDKKLEVSSTSELEYFVQKLKKELVK